MSRVVAPLLTRAIARYSTTATQTAQKYSNAEIESAVKAQGGQMRHATELITKKDFEFLLLSAVNIARARVAPRGPLFAQQ